MKANSTKNGSVLLITLLVVSLLMVLVVSFSVYVRIELRDVVSRQQLMEARSNAKLAMHLGLNELQITAGRDQASTARAEILGAGVTGGNRYWTGVWDTTNPGGSPVWLVSGTTPDPVSTEGNVVLVGTESVGSLEDHKISVPEVFSGTMAYSWYISDEGVKADISPIDAFEDISVPEYANAETNFTHRDTWRLDRARKLGSPISDLQGLLPASSDFTHLSRNPAELANNLDTEQLLSRLHSYLDTTIEWPTPTWLGADFPKENFHAFSARTYSIQANPLDGGLKQDLSHLRRMSTLPTQATLDGVFDSPQWDYLTPAIWEFANFDRLNQFGDLGNTLPTADPALRPDVSTDFMTGPVSFHTSPIPTEFSWIAGLGIRSNSSGATRDIYLYFYSTLEKLNPYAWSLATGNGTGASPSSPSDLQVRISGFPSIDINNITKGRSMTLDLSDLVVAVPSNSYYDHFPGYVRTNFTPLSGFRSITSGRGVFALKVGEFPITPDIRDDFRVSFGTSDIEIEIAESNSNLRSSAERVHWAFFLTNSSLASGVPRFPPGDDPSIKPEPIRSFTLRNWGDFSIFYEGGIPGDNNRTRFVHGGSAMDRSRISSDTINFGIQGKLVDDWPQVDSLTLGFEHALDALFTYSHPAQKHIDIDMNAPESGDGEYFDFRQPDNVSRSAVANLADTFHGAYFGSATGNRIARLFDLPSNEPFNIGSFNQLMFDGFPYQPLGNLPYNRSAPVLSGTGNGPGESLHNYFDRYFFSTLPSTTSQWDGVTPLPNQRIVAARKSLNDSILESPMSAEELFVKGGFNLNSLSTEAWTSILQHSKVSQFTHTEAQLRTNAQLTGVTRRTSLNGDTVFYSQPFGGDHLVESQASFTYEPRNAGQTDELATRFGSDTSHEAFIQGYRSLSETEIANLAQAITEEIRSYTTNNQTPFLSLSHFLNEGVLQNAIDQVTGLNETANGRIPTLSPAYFGVGSLLNHLSSHLFTRSDTFIIRSSGKVISDGSGETLAKAYLETRVQRVPYEDVGIYGRRFRILGTKWVEVEP